MNSSTNDIQNRQDIECLIQSFYGKVNQDSLLSPIFNQIAGVHWESHLPVMYNFWSSLLLGDKSYQGNPFQKHIPLPIHKAHFDRWLALFTETVDEHFTGEVASEAKMRARSIAGIFQHKLEFIHAAKRNG